jgi:signal peptidase I
MICKKCGSKNVEKDGEKYVCRDCGAEATVKKEEKKKSAFREVVDFCFPIVLALVVAFVLKTCVFANAQVPSESMINTIQKGDRLIASRLEYRFNDPERFDIIIFKFPDDVAAHEKDKSHKVDYFVKRIIGLPGETVEIVNGVVYVTDKNGNTQQLIDDFVTACTPTGDYGPYNVPEDSYFVLGDNRESSHDSRAWETTNYVHKDLIVGKVKFRYYPFDTAGKLDKVDYNELQG